MSRQTSIPGTDVDNPEVRDAIERWLEACERAKKAAERRQEADDAIVVTMLRLGISYHPYINPETGKRKYRVVDTTPKGKSVSARPTAPEDMEPDEPEVSESVAVERVEHRKVSRSKAQKAIAEEKAARTKRANGQAQDVGEFRPARSDWDDDEATP
jgi:hypothetical protein